MKRARKSGIAAAIALPTFYLLWILFTGTFSRHELLVGIVADALSVVGVLVVISKYPARFAPTLKELLAGWRLCWYLISGTWEVLVVAGRDVAGGKRAQSLFRVVPFSAGKQDNPQDTARRVLATLYTTITPTTIVLGVNVSEKKLLFHEIQRGRVSRMTRALGAQP